MQVEQRQTERNWKLLYTLISFSSLLSPLVVIHRRERRQEAVRSLLALFSHESQAPSAVILRYGTFQVSNSGKVSKPAKQRHIFYVHHNRVDQRNFMDICNTPTANTTPSPPIQENWQHSRKGEKMSQDRPLILPSQRKNTSFSSSPDHFMLHPN